ncbi:hypothetical protein DFS34DRAFT_674876 [Phlyctochytrium arcticum]|nr:hypothetical protein DFS34DRAFT_674876 [Phlyctochytrium arcticum]
MDRVVPRRSSSGQSHGALYGNPRNPATNGINGNGGSTTFSRPSPPPGLGPQSRLRTASASSVLAGIGTKDLVLGPGGAMGRAMGGSASPVEPAPNIGFSSGVMGNFGNHTTAKRPERRERNLSLNGNAQTAAWGRSNPGPPTPNGNNARQQPWPQLSSSTLGVFKPLVPSPVAENRQFFAEPQRDKTEPAPANFENNFPSLGNGTNGTSNRISASGPTLNHILRPVAAWGKPDAASIVAGGGPPPGPIETELSAHVDDGEAAEIARLKALIPKLDKPKFAGKAASMRERGKNGIIPKGLGMPNQQRSASFTKPSTGLRPSILNKANTVSAPVMIANRPKLRTSLKSSPRPQSHLPVAEVGPAGVNGVRNDDCNSLTQASGDSAEFDLGELAHSNSEEDIFALEGSNSACSMLNSVTSQSDEFPGLSTASSRSTTPTASGPGTPESHFERRDMTRSTSHELGLAPFLGSSKLHEPADHHASKSDIVRSTAKSANYPKPEPYESVFQYSASLEKEERFLRSLGWDKSAYYDSDVDESEFVITEEEKQEFFRGHGKSQGFC